MLSVIIVLAGDESSNYTQLTQKLWKTVRTVACGQQIRAAERKEKCNCKCCIFVIYSLLTSCHDTTLTQLWHYTLHNRSGMTFVPFHIIDENHMMDAWCWIWKVPWKLTLHGLALRHSRHLLALLLLAGRRHLDPVPDVPGSVLLLVPSLSRHESVLSSVSWVPSPQCLQTGPLWSDLDSSPHSTAAARNLLQRPAASN